MANPRNKIRGLFQRRTLVPPLVVLCIVQLTAARLPAQVPSGPALTPYASVNPATLPQQTVPAANPSPATPGAAPADQMPIAPAQVAAQPPQDQMVLDVRVAGNKTISLNKIRQHIKTRKGRPYDAELIQEDVRRLDSTRLFVTIKTFYQQYPAGRVVIFEVIERPLLKEVLFVGNKEVHRKVLQKEAVVKEGDPVDAYAIEEARRKLEEFYHKRGFNGAHITLLEGAKPEDRRAVFLINEGVKQKVWKVNFVGNTIASEARLRTQIKTHPPYLVWILGGELNRKQIDEDKQTLTDYYRALGFFQARVGDPIYDYNEKQDWVTVTFVIDEGIRSKIRNVSVIGNTKFTSEELLAKVKLTDANYFDKGKMLADVNMLRDTYGGEGYVYADVKPDARMLEQPGQLDLIYHIKEGRRYRVGKIDIAIKGEYPHTQLTTILNRLSFAPGEVADIRKIRDSERRLKASSLFEAKQGSNGPSIVFVPPGQKSLEEDNRSEVAEKPGEPEQGPPKFRGQSPDPQTHTTWYPPANAAAAEQDELLSVTVDCGDWTLREDAADIPLSTVAPPPQYSGGVKAVRCQAPDANTMVSLPELQNGRQAAPQQDALNKALGDLTRVLAPGRKNKTQTTVAHIHQTQYTPDSGQTTPSLPNRPLRWISTQATPTATPAATTTAVTSYEQTTTTDATAPQAVPVQPAPQYAGAMPGNAQQPLLNPGAGYVPGALFNPDSPFNGGPADGGLQMPLLPVEASALEAQTGRIMVGVGVNSDSGLIGQISIDEQNFDWTRWPTSWEDIRNGTAFRGAGQRFRLEATPGTTTSRYVVSFEEPYLLNTRVALGLSGFYYTRAYTEYYDQRLGGRMSLGYAFRPDLMGTISYEGAKINITDPCCDDIPDLVEVLNRDLAMHKFGLTMSYDKRDNRFLATEGYYLEGTLEQVLGSYQYPRANLDLRKYFGLHARPDGSGRHVLSLSGSVSWTGDNTPIYDRYYAGGFSTIRGFSFRGVSPTQYSATDGNVYVGGNFQLLASAEYLFPITADDMLRGVVFCDTGTVEPSLNDWTDKYRVAPGFGLRITVPAMGPAPIALDFAFPVCYQNTDDKEVFSFFVGFLR